MDKLTETILQVIYRKRESCDRVASELDTFDQDPLVISFYEGKVEAFDEIINLLTNSKQDERTKQT
jgi:hypothetical protein